jgi:hypothetical protein
VSFQLFVSGFAEFQTVQTNKYSAGKVINRSYFKLPSELTLTHTKLYMFKGPDSVLSSFLLKNSAKAVNKQKSGKNYGGFSWTKIKAVLSFQNALLYAVD